MFALHRNIYKGGLVLYFMVDKLKTWEEMHQEEKNTENPFDIINGIIDEEQK